MADILDTLKNKPGFLAMNGATNEEIKDAESQLGVSFSKDYWDYVAAYGASTYENHELTGICKSPRLNVVEVTKEERKNYPDLPVDWYVLEQLHIDSVSVWQSGTGEIYQLMPGEKPKKIFNSFIEYVNE